jgi:hypothetical protein
MIYNIGEKAIEVLPLTVSPPTPIPGETAPVCVKGLALRQNSSRRSTPTIGDHVTPIARPRGAFLPGSFVSRERIPFARNRGRPLLPTRIVCGRMSYFRNALESSISAERPPSVSQCYAKRMFAFANPPRADYAVALNATTFAVSGVGSIFQYRSASSGSTNSR